jgi:hypothetical protein
MYGKHSAQFLTLQHFTIAWHAQRDTCAIQCETRIDAPNTSKGRGGGSSDREQKRGAELKKKKNTLTRARTRRDRDPPRRLPRLPRPRAEPAPPRGSQGPTAPAPSPTSPATNHLLLLLLLGPDLQPTSQGDTSSSPMQRLAPSGNGRCGPLAPSIEHRAATSRDPARG